MSKAYDTRTQAHTGFIKTTEGLSAARLEDIEARIKLVQQKMQEEGKTVHLLVAAGKLYYEGGKLEDALSTFREARALDGKNAQALNNLSVVYYEKGLLDSALECCLDSLGVQDKQAAVHNNVGVIYSEQGRWDDAVKHYEKAGALLPGDSTVHANLGAAYSFLGCTKEAKEEYAKALEIDPDHVTAHYCLGMEAAAPAFLEVGRAISVGALLKVSSQLVYKGRHAPKVFSSRIEDITEDTITIAAPLLRGDILPFRTNMGVVIGTPGDDALYGFYTKIVDVKRGAVPQLVLKRPKAPQRVQRRKYVRIGTSVLKSARILNTHEVHTLYTVRHKADRNLSAGGVLLTVSKSLPFNTILMLELTLPNEEMKVAGQVARCTKNERGDYDVGVRFVGLTEKERARILQFVQSRQIESMKLGASDKHVVMPKGRIIPMAKRAKRGHA